MYYRDDMYKGIDWPEYTSEKEEYADVTSFAALKYFITRDFERINRRITCKKLIKTLFVEPGFKFIFWLRITRYARLRGKKGIVLFAISRLILKHYGEKFGFDISPKIKIGPGLAIGHWGYIVIQADDVIGSNCFLRPGVVLGKKSVFEGGAQVIGDNVEFGAGAKCIGAMTIGNNVTIGANSVVTHDVPNDCVVAGAPAKIVRWKKQL